MNKFLALVAIVGFGAITASAQQSASTSAQCTTVVVRSLSIEANQDLDFGFQAQGVGEVTISSESNKAVRFTITGEEWMDVRISYLAPEALVNQNGAKLPFKALVTANESDMPVGAKELATGDVRALSEKGNQFVYLGGMIDVAKDQDRGFYTGQFDINVEYTF